MSIIQPRLENISTYEISAADLRAWGESIKPIAQMAFEGKGEQHPGDWCRFCRAKAVCKACMEEALALAREEFLDLDGGALADEAEETDATAPYNADTSAPVLKSPGLVSFSELVKVLPTLNRISSWIESVFAFVSGEAINHGVPVEGYKVVEGRSKRIFTDTKAVIKAAESEGYTDIYKQELLTLTEFEKMMGKKKFAEILGQYVTKPPGEAGAGAGVRPKVGRWICLQRRMSLRRWNDASGSGPACSDPRMVQPQELFYTGVGGSAGRQT